MRDVDLLLSDIASGLGEIEAIYQRDLLAKHPSADLQRKVRHVLNDERSALDFVAHAVAMKYGLPTDKAYFPITLDRTKFPKLLDSNITSLTKSQPKIAAAFERHQPYHEAKVALQYLPALSVANKHHGFSAQTRQQQRRIQSGGVSWDPDAVKFGGGVSIGGRPVDPFTQRTPPGTYTETLYVDWRFDDLMVSVLHTLKSIADIVRAATTEVRHEARLR